MFAQVPHGKRAAADTKKKALVNLQDVSAASVSVEAPATGECEGGEVGEGSGEGDCEDD